jgi:CBS domain-containing protein
MHKAGVKQLPVVNETGQLLGIVSRGDLLKVFTRPDEAIRSQIINEVIVGDLMMNPSRFVIEVDDGVVMLEGKAERRSLIPSLVRAVYHVDGVVRVEDRLSFEVDDRDAGMPMVYPFMRP